MSTFSKEPKIKTYSKSNAVSREPATSALFDLIVNTGETEKPKTETTNSKTETKGQKKRRGRSKKTSQKTKQATTGGKALSAINEKEDSCSDYNESSTFMIFKENLKKKKCINQKDRECTKKAQVRTRNQRRSNTKQESEHDEEDSSSKVGDELFVENVKCPPLKNVNKSRSRRDDPYKMKVFQRATKIINNGEMKYRHAGLEKLNNDKLAQRNLNASIEIARDKAEPPPCSFPFVETSVLFLEEPGRKSSDDDSALAGDDSFSSEYGEMPTPVIQTEESSKYTYEYVSTYTQGTSGGSHFTTASVNSPYVPMKRCYNMNSTTHPEKMDINELEFPISPICDLSETSPVEQPCQSSTRTASKRNRRKKLNTATKKSTCQPPKWSTMLDDSDTTEVNLKFPVSLTQIEIVDPEICHIDTIPECVMERGGIDDCNDGRGSSGSRQKHKLSCDRAALGKIDEKQNSTVEEIEIVTPVILPYEIPEEVREEIIDKSCDVRSKSLEAISGSEKNCHGVNTDATITPISAMKKGVSMLKSLKRKASRCFSKSRKYEKSCRVTFSEKTSVSDYGTENEGQTSSKCLSPVSKNLSIPITPDCRVDEQVFVDLRKRLDENGQHDLEVCTVSRLCHRYNRFLR